MNERTDQSRNRNGCQELSSPTTFNADLAFIRRRVPIRDVAATLGLQLSGRYRATCWRPEAHRHGDADPSVSFQAKKNCGICWTCDQHSWGVIDLVMMVRGCEFPAAIVWICEHWPVPAARPGQHIVHRNGWSPTFRVGCGYSRLEWVIRSGVWAQLSPSQCSVLAVLDSFTDAETGQVTISYRGLARYAGVGSFATIRGALRRFQELGLLEIKRSLDGDGFRTCSRYQLTFDSPRFLSIVNSIYQHHQEEIELDRAFRVEERKRRRRQKALTLPVQENPLYTQCSRVKVDATPRVYREVRRAP